MTKTKTINKNLILLSLCVLLIITIFLCFFICRHPVPVKDYFLGIISRLIHKQLIDAKQIDYVFYRIRLDFPPILLACLVGCCLSVAGVCYQSIFQNPMASPSTLGASGGAAFGASLAILLITDASCDIFIRKKFIITSSAFFFSMLSVLLVYAISRKTRGDKVVGLVLSGMMVSSLFTSAISIIKYVADPYNHLPQIMFWLTGSFNGLYVNDLKFALIPMLIGLIPLYLLRWKINILTLGDDEAKSLGINPQCLRFIIIFFATLITATSISISGMIGWVGLVIPHFTRRIIGSNCKYLLPASMVIGSIFLLLVSHLSMNLICCQILPLGIVSPFVTAPFFLNLIFTTNKK